MKQAGYGSNHADQRSRLPVKRNAQQADQRRHGLPYWFAQLRSAAMRRNGFLHRAVSLNAGLKPGIEFIVFIATPSPRVGRNRIKPPSRFTATFSTIRERAQAVRSNLNSLVVQVFDELSHGRKVDQRLFQEARPYLKEVADPKGSQHQTPKKIWVIDQTAVNRTSDRAGWLNIKSNVVEIPEASRFISFARAD